MGAIARANATAHALVIVSALRYSKYNNSKTNREASLCIM
jgi:hypothetical protein